MLVEINNDNPIWREPERRKEFWIALNSDDSEPENYPVDVLNVNGDLIGTANDKDEYLAIWNADADNAIRGFLMGEGRPFVYVLLEDPFSAANAILTENGEELTTENGETFNIE